MSTHEVWRADQAIDLTATEFNLLRSSCATPGRCCPRPRSSTPCGTDGFNGDSNIVEIYISYLRKKIDATTPR